MSLPVEVYERQLDRIQSFFPRIDTKVSAIFAISAGQIAIAAINLSAGDLKRWWIVVPLCIFALVSAYVLGNLYLCAYPHLKGGHSSLVYFAEIAKLREAEFIAKYGALTEDVLKTDLAGQIWRNSEIVKCKYAYLRSATVSAMLSVLPWAAFLLATSLTNLQLPKLATP